MPLLMGPGTTTDGPGAGVWVLGDDSTPAPDDGTGPGLAFGAATGAKIGAVLFADGSAGDAAPSWASAGPQPIATASSAVASSQLCARRALLPPVLVLLLQSCAARPIAEVTACCW